MGQWWRFKFRARVGALSVKDGERAHGNLVHGGADVDPRGVGCVEVWVRPSSRQSSQLVLLGIKQLKVVCRAKGVRNGPCHVFRSIQTTPLKHQSLGVSCAFKSLDCGPCPANEYGYWIACLKSAGVQS